MVIEDVLEPRQERLYVAELGGTDAYPRGLVRVGGTDAATRRAYGIPSLRLLGYLVEHDVVRHHEVGALADDQPVPDADAPRFEAGDLVEEHVRVYDDPVADDVQGMRPDDARREQVELELTLLGDNSMAGVVAAGESGDNVAFSGKNVDELALAFIAPLGAKHCCDRHPSLLSTDRVPSSPGECCEYYKPKVLPTERRTKGTERSVPLKNYSTVVLRFQRFDGFGNCSNFMRALNAHNHRHTRERRPLHNRPNGLSFRAQRGI